MEGNTGKTNIYFPVSDRDSYYWRSTSAAWRRRQKTPWTIRSLDAVFPQWCDYTPWTLHWSGMWGVRWSHEGIQHSDCLIGHMGKFRGVGEGGMSCIAFKGLRSTAQCQRWPVSYIHMHDPEESLFHDIGFVLVPSSTHQPIFTEVHASRSRSNLPSGVANSPFLFLEVVIMCLPVKRLNQKAMNRLEWHLEGTDEYFWW